MNEIKNTKGIITIMAFTVRYAKYDDYLECHRVEKETMGDYVYLNDSWNLFQTSKGEMVCVFDGDKMVGIGRFTVLFDNSGWLETLRVVPEYQNKGVGKLIYKEYLKLAKEYNCPSMAMFTGVNNKASAGLAEINGLSKASEHTGYHLTNLDRANAHDFKYVAFEKAVELVLPLKEKYNNYFTMNRTFFRINEENIKGLSMEGKVFYDEESKSTIVCGGRFQKGATVHIALMDGDYNKCLDFAANLAKATGVKKISCTFARENKEIEDVLINAGFEKEPSNLKTLEIKF